MIARFCGGMLGLFAFGVTVILGVAAGHRPDAVLSRSLWALAIFCVIGLVVGAAAQAVVNEYMTRKEAELFPADRSTVATEPEDKPAAAKAKPAGLE